MKKAKKVVVGIWRITGMEVWDADYFDMEVPAHLTIRDDLTGAFQFGLVQGDIDARVSEVDGVARVEFSWSGADESDPVSGRGSMAVTGDQAQGRILSTWAMIRLLPPCARMLRPRRCGPSCNTAKICLHRARSNRWPRWSSACGG